MNKLGHLLLGIKTTLPSFHPLNPTVSPLSPFTNPEDPLSAEIQRLEELSTQEALRLKHDARLPKSMAPLTPHQKIMDLAG
ncbi:MAG: hypothetical protein H6631_13160 [Anaerolineaceae bacterium]|nr:hypothetical protein [Anaerolineaceae bacterium]MCB9098252.1 hypothetical protein [Anaerolineales bacterium]